MYDEFTAVAYVRKRGGRERRAKMREWSPQAVSRPARTPSSSLLPGGQEPLRQVDSLKSGERRARIAFVSGSRCSYHVTLGLTTVCDRPVSPVRHPKR